MSGNWSSVVNTFNKFVEPFKNQGDACKHYFSVVLFDHGGRLAYKRMLAKDI
jgi:hypothetical protein